MFNEATFREITSPDDGRSISRNVASLNILVRDVINFYCVMNTEQTSKNIFTYMQILHVFHKLNLNTSKMVEGALICIDAKKQCFILCHYSFKGKESSTNLIIQ